MPVTTNSEDIAAAAAHANTVVADAAALANEVVAKAALRATDVIAQAVAIAAASPTLTIVADQAASRAVEQVFLRLGVDLSDKVAVYTTKEAFGWLIRFKNRIEKVYAALLPAIATSAVTALVGFMIYHYKS